MWSYRNADVMTDLILELLQSFLISRKNSRFPEPFIPSGQFGDSMAGDLAAMEEWRNALKDLQTFLCLPQPLNFVENASVRDICHKAENRWKKGDRIICFHTSGSTGTPRKCFSTEKELIEEAEFLSGILGSVETFVSIAPPQHCYGFMFGLFLPWKSGKTVKRLLPFPGNFFLDIRNNEARVGLPFIYEMVKDPPHPLRESWLISAGAPLNREAFHSLVNAGFKVLEIFGSSETGVLGLRTRPEIPFTLADYFERIDAQSVTRRANGRKIELTDKLRWIGKTSFYPCGRMDKMVQVGGKNVSLAHVRQKIGKINGVRDCVVRSMDTDPEGRLKAFIVLDQPADCELKEKIYGALNLFPSHERPVKINFGLSVPRNSMGKLRDWD